MRQKLVSVLAGLMLSAAIVALSPFVVSPIRSVTIWDVPTIQWGADSVRQELALNQRREAIVQDEVHLAARPSDSAAQVLNDGKESSAKGFVVNDRDGLAVVPFERPAMYGYWGHCLEVFVEVGPDSTTLRAVSQLGSSRGTELSPVSFVQNGHVIPWNSKLISCEEQTLVSSKQDWHEFVRSHRNVAICDHAVISVRDGSWGDAVFAWQQLVRHDFEVFFAIERTPEICVEPSRMTIE